MSIENEIENLGTTTEVPESQPDTIAERPAKVEPRFQTAVVDKDKSIRSLLQTNIEKAKREEDEPLPTALTAKERKAAKEKEQVESPAPAPAVASTAAPANLKPVPQSTVASRAAGEKHPADSKPEDAVPPDPSQAVGIPAPTALTKEEKELWATLPEQMQKAFVRREEDSQKGVEKLKAQYKPIEDALAPIRPLLQQRGLTEAHAVKQLFDWHTALSSSHKGAQINAFKALAQSHGVDINQLAPPPQYQPPVAQPTQPANPTQPDPLAQIQPYLQQTLEPLQQRLSAYEQQLQNQRLENANKELATFSTDKPHFEKARYRMAEILQTAANFGRPVTLQEAYDEAVWGMPDLRSEIMQEQEEKRQAEMTASQEAYQKQIRDELLVAQKKEEEELTKKRELEAIEKARRASVSPRSTAPVAAMNLKGPKRPLSVADSIRASIKEVSSTI